MERKPDFSGIFGETFALIGDGAKGVLLFVVVIAGLNTALIALGFVPQSDDLGSFNMGVMIDADDGAVAGLFQLGIAVVTVIGSYLLLSHFLETRGRLPSRETRIWAYVGMTILSALGMVLGLILLIVPGVILAVRWSAASGFLIGNRTGVTESLSASWQATKGHSWPIFGAAVVMVIILMVVAGVFGAIAGVLGSVAAIAAVTSIADAAGTALFLAFGIAVYLLVHADSGELGEVFS